MTIRVKRGAVFVPKGAIKHHDRRTKRLRTRAARQRAAVRDQVRENYGAIASC